VTNTVNMPELAAYPRKQADLRYSAYRLTMDDLMPYCKCSSPWRY